MSSGLKRGDFYKSFEVLNVFDVPDYHSTAIHLRHQKTGLEVFHLLNEDSENLFAFAFRTPNTKSTGVAHIIEHSVLCGSELYPVKDPFVVMSNQSVKTYLNAMTYSDKTVYPASSIAKADYFNLMSVYGDAVFFPRLEKEIFMQEAHRLELDDNGKASIQGVVYNEMKGSYSSFESVVYDIAIASLLKGSIYEKDSGGDPLEIPTLSYNDFLDFHRKWYRPDNCFVFLHGNIPTEEQLDFLQENFLDRLEKKFPGIDVSEQARQAYLKDFLNLVVPDNIEKPLEVYAEGPSGDGEEANTVLVNWNVGRSENAVSATEKLVLAGILCNHDGSPLQKALLESGLGEDTAPQNGMFSSIYTSIFTAGLRGVKKGYEKKVESVILDTIKKLVENGISKKDIESTLTTLEFSHREIKRGHGPYALALMARPIYGWQYGDGLENQIRLRSHLEKIRAKIESDDSYLPSLLRKLFLENKNRSLVVVAPSKNYTEKRENAEKELLAELLKKTSAEEIKAENEKLHLFQSQEDDDSCLPHLTPADFIKDGHPMMNLPSTIIDELRGFDESAVPFIKNVENTNGIIYFDLGFPADVLEPSDYPVLPAFADCVTECGWNNLNWAQTAEECALKSGGLGVNLLTMEGPNTKNALKFAAKHNWIKRDWLIFRMAMLEEKAGEALSLLKDCLLGTDFSDEKRIQDILNESRNDFEASIIPDGHVFASTRVWCRHSRKNAVDEIWNGLSQYYSIKKLADAPVRDTASSFRRIFVELKRGGAFIHVTAEKSGFEKLSQILPEFISEVKIHAPVDARLCSDADFFALTDIEGDSTSGCNEFAFVTSSQVAYASECVPASKYEDENSFHEEVCAHWLSNNLLWEKIRTIGGAYGAFCNAEPMSGLLVFASYRDPAPLDSCNVFEECIRGASEIDFSDEDVQRAVMGCYSHFIQPQSPKGRGSSALTRLLYGILDEDRERKVLGILHTQKDDLKAAFRRLAEGVSAKEIDKIRKRVFICDKKMILTNGFAGKIINLPL
ncbi:insulinase family protein [uncultured Treponema sp.]|uniref:insulinase family protein n=1 Tax=uncultured Treponema sp. TaxID=162155 RepID=UPI0025E43D23|nr:insulinase family protein [uncultured Treponema sp.]